VLRALSADVKMHHASHVDGTSDNLDDSPLELCGNTNEDSLSGRQMDVKSTEDDMIADLSAAEAVEEEPREIAEVSGHLEADSSAEVGNAEKALEILDAEVRQPLFMLNVCVAQLVLFLSHLVISKAIYTMKLKCDIGVIYKF